MMNELSDLYGPVAEFSCCVRVLYGIHVPTTCWPCIAKLIQRGYSQSHLFAAFGLFRESDLDKQSEELGTFIENKLPMAAEFLRLYGELPTPELAIRWDIARSEIVPTLSALNDPEWQAAFASFNSAKHSQPNLWN